MGNEIFPLYEGVEECPDCEADMVLMSYKGIGTGCPECIPDGLVSAYIVEYPNAGTQ